MPIIYTFFTKGETVFEEKKVENSLCGCRLGIISACSNGLPVSGFIVDKETGAPAPCNYQLWESLDGGMSGSANHKRMLAGGSTDESGFFTISDANMPVGAPYELEFTDGNDILIEDGFIYGSTDRPVPVIIRIYTDRQCYRPGDVLRLSCLAYRTDGCSLGKAEVASEIAISLYDARWNQIDSCSRVTDGFGMADYEFHIPAGAASGRYTIKACCEDDYSAYRAIYVTSDASLQQTGQHMTEFQGNVITTEEPDYVTPGNSVYEVGQSAVFNVSAEDGDYLYYIIRGRFGVVKTGVLRSSGEAIEISIPVNAEMYGTFRSCFYKYHDGLCLQQEIYTKVPYSDKQLALTAQLSPIDFRPGHMVSCNIHVANNDGSSAYASLMVGMFVNQDGGNCLNHWTLSPWNQVLSEESALYGDNSGNIEFCGNQTVPSENIPCYIPYPVLFIPSLRTDKNGNAMFTFEVPRNYGRVRLQVIALTDRLAVGNLEI